ncbi:MAG: hypothetical protein ACYC7D_01460 [Nitrososphaerales archaeon]
MEAPIYKQAAPRFLEKVVFNVSNWNWFTHLEAPLRHAHRSGGQYNHRIQSNLVFTKQFAAVT